MVGYSQGPTMEQQLIKIAKYAVIGLFIIIVLFNTFFTIHAGERGVITTFGKPSERIANEGLNIKIPFAQSVYKYDVKTQVMKFDNKAGQGDNSEYSSLFSFTKDQMELQVAIVINYHIEPNDVMNIYRTYGTQDYYHVNVLEPIVRESVKAHSAKYNVAELATNRDEFSNVIKSDLMTKFAEKKAIIEGVYVVNIEPPAAYKNAINDKMIAEQQALQAQNTLKTKQFEADQQIATAEGAKQSKIKSAEGDAEAIRVVDEQLRKSSAYIEYYKLQRWDGHLSQVVGTGTPLVNIQ